MINQPEPKEKKPVDYLKAAKSYQKDVTSNNARSFEAAISCSLIFIGEQLARIADVMEKDDVSLDEAVKIWGAPK
jgi:exonuclease VII small subunit